MFENGLIYPVSVTSGGGGGASNILPPEFLINRLNSLRDKKLVDFRIADTYSTNLTSYTKPASFPIAVQSVVPVHQVYDTSPYNTGFYLTRTGGTGITANDNGNYYSASFPIGSTLSGNTTVLGINPMSGFTAIFSYENFSGFGGAVGQCFHSSSISSANGLTLFRSGSLYKIRFSLGGANYIDSPLFDLATIGGTNRHSIIGTLESPNIARIYLDGQLVQTGTISTSSANTDILNIGSIANNALPADYIYAGYIGAHASDTQAQAMHNYLMLDYVS